MEKKIGKHLHERILYVQIVYAYTKDGFIAVIKVKFYFPFEDEDRASQMDCICVLFVYIHIIHMNFDSAMNRGSIFGRRFVLAISE